MKDKTEIEKFFYMGKVFNTHDEFIEGVFAYGKERVTAESVEQLCDNFKKNLVYNIMRLYGPNLSNKEIRDFLSELLMDAVRRLTAIEKEKNESVGNG